ncbi:MAG: ABC transporter ATP-binding protein [Clostridia bacterium]|nr:ABC transporter ATP-binding protein [Clostridia bacterium]
MITIDRLTLSYGSQQVLKDCSLQVEAGSHVALMGPSGCGKTSLINVIAGLLTPDSGKVSVNGKVSYVFQEPALFPWLTAVDNINVVLSDGPETLPRAEQLLEAVGLSDCRDKYPHQLSGGQKQRIAICRALAYGGDILLLDEPLKGLDADTRDQVSALLRQEWTGKTLLLVTHDPSEAQSLCDRVYRWQEGTFR